MLNLGIHLQVWLLFSFLSSALTLPCPRSKHCWLCKQSKCGPQRLEETKAWGSQQPCGQRELHYDWVRIELPEPITMQARQVCSGWFVLVLGRMDASKAQHLLSGPQDWETEDCSK